MLALKVIVPVLMAVGALMYFAASKEKAYLGKTSTGDPIVCVDGKAYINAREHSIFAASNTYTPLHKSCEEFLREQGKQ